jgi:hypothetical protein
MSVERRRRGGKGVRGRERIRGEGRGGKRRELLLGFHSRFTLPS